MSRNPIPLALEAHARTPAATSVRPWGDDAKRILCVRLDNLGDVLMTTPALHALRWASPQRHLTLLASRAGAAAARHLADVDDVIEYDAPWVKQNAPPDFRNDLAMRDRLARGNFDAAVIFSVYSQNPLPAAMLCHLAGIGKRLAHCRENPYGLLTDWVAETEPQHGTRHEVERQLALVAHVGAETQDRRMRFDVSPLDAASLARKLSLLHASADEPYIVIHPGASAASRCYPPERFAQAAERLAHITGCAVFVSGAQAEADLTALVSGAHPNAIDLAGALNLGELAALIRGARVLISNNSGPVHIASALGTPVVDLYALTNPQHMPWQTPHRVLYQDVPCRWCYRSVCPEGHHACLNGVAVDDVVAAACELMEERRANREALAVPLTTL
jgi:lipopolysaccharide heptosyltransferase II